MPKAKILIVSESPILPTGMGVVIRLISGTLLDRYPDRYELHQVALYHSYPVAEPRWPLYPTRRARDAQGTPIFLAADANGEITGCCLPHRFIVPDTHFRVRRARSSAGGRRRARAGGNPRVRGPAGGRGAKAGRRSSRAATVQAGYQNARVIRPSRCGWLSTLKRLSTAS